MDYERKQAAAPSPPSSPSPPSQGDNDDDELTVMVTCKDCGHQVPAANMAIHQATACGHHRNKRHQQQQQQQHGDRRNLPMESLSSSTAAAATSAAISETTTTSSSSSSSSAVPRYPPSYTSSSSRNRSVDDDITNSPPRSRARLHRFSVEDSDDDDEIEEVTSFTEVINLAEDDDDNDNNHEEGKEGENDDDKIEEEWACPCCTLHNPIESYQCDACGHWRRDNQRSGGNGNDMRRPDQVQNERLIPLSDFSYYGNNNRNNINNNHNNDGNNNALRNLGSSALLGSAIGAFAGFTRNRNVLNSALEGAVAGAVAGSISNHFTGSNNPPSSSSSSNNAARSSSLPSSSSRTYLNVYSMGPAAQAGFSYRIGNRSGSFGTASRYNHRSNHNVHQIPLHHFRMMRAAGMGAGAGGENIDNMDYERLLEVFGDGSENKGASPGTIQNLPSSVIKNVEKELPDDCRKCAICLDEFQNGHKRKTLPCLHGFHEKCIDRWLETNASCPICKFEVGR